MVVHEKAVGATVEWYTPPTVFKRLGIEFDLDPAAGRGDFVPARRKLYEHGDEAEWEGRVWLNPPYGRALPDFVDHMVQHMNGILLVAARTETRWFQRAARMADIVCFLSDRIHFIRPDGYQGRSSHASVLMGWQRDCADAVRQFMEHGWIVDQKVCWRCGSRNGDLGIHFSPCVKEAA